MLFFRVINDFFFFFDNNNYNYLIFLLLVNISLSIEFARRNNFYYNPNLKKFSSITCIILLYSNITIKTNYKLYYEYILVYRNDQ